MPAFPKRRFQHGALPVDTLHAGTALPWKRIPEAVSVPLPMMIEASSVYPTADTERDQWILAHRPRRTLLDPRRPYAFSVEDERSATGEVVPVATVFLTNRECPWRCLMCDLWRNTLTENVPAGAIPAQIDYALTALRRRARSSSITVEAFSIAAPSRLLITPLSPRE